MKIATEVVFQMTTDGLVELSRTEFEYVGPLALAGGGPDKTQVAQEQASANLANTQADAGKQALAFTQSQQALANPLYQSMLQGDPNFNAETDYAKGQTAQAYQPARVALAKRLSSFSSLPSGFSDAAYRDLDTAQAHDYDSQLSNLLAQNLAIKQAGASGLLGNATVLTPASLFGGANSANTTVMNTPRTPGLAGVLGGVAGNVLGGVAQSGKGLSSFFG
jgi:hypothetical protein